MADGDSSVVGVAAVAGGGGGGSDSRSVSVVNDVADIPGMCPIQHPGAISQLAWQSDKQSASGQADREEDC